MAPFLTDHPCNAGKGTLRGPRRSGKNEAAIPIENDRSLYFLMWTYLIRLGQLRPRSTDQSSRSSRQPATP